MRISLDIQRGARSRGGLSASERQGVGDLVTDPAVYPHLRDTGCVVNFEQSSAGSPVPISFRFNWETTWFAGGLAETLVHDVSLHCLGKTPGHSTDRYKEHADPIIEVDATMGTAAGGAEGSDGQPAKRQRSSRATPGARTSAAPRRLPLQGAAAASVAAALTAGAASGASRVLPRVLLLVLPWVLPRVLRQELPRVLPWVSPRVPLVRVGA